MGRYRKNKDACIVEDAFEVERIRIELAKRQGFTDPDIMDVFNEESGRNQEGLRDWGMILELKEKGDKSNYED